ncbi:MAG: FtsX-like permease family protein, partial [Acidobacteriota bacterium]
TGVDLDNLLTFQLSPALSGYDDQRTGTLFTQLKQRLEGSPGILSAAWANVSILSGDEWDSTMSVEGHKAKDGEDMQAFMNSLSPGYFATMRIPLLEGRDFRPGDESHLGADGIVETRVAIVNQHFADHFFPGQSALGRHLAFGDRPGVKFAIEIVGVAANSLYEGPREGVRRQVFIPSWGKNGATFYVRTRSASASAFSQIRGELRALDAGIPVYAMKTVEGQLDETLLTDRLIAMLSAGFGLLATVLASVGLYGVMAFVVARRRKEMGLRLALGADPGHVVWLVMKEVLVLLAIGVAVGVPAAVGLGRLVSTQLYGITPNDPWLALSTMAMLAVVSAAAGFIPAHRASRVDPNLALRYE